MDVSKAVESLNSSSTTVKAECLRILVGKRENDAIKGCVEALRDKFTENNNTSDTVDGIKEYCCRKTAFAAAVLFATLNDDPDTLEMLKDWWKEKESSQDLTGEEVKHCHHAIIFACIMNYTRCIRPLYQMGYKIELHKEDEKYINDILNMNGMVNNMQFYFHLWCGTSSIDPQRIFSAQESIEYKDFERGRERESIPLQNLRNSASAAVKGVTKSKLAQKCPFDQCSDDGDDVSDIVENFLKLKAFSNPNYLAVDFQESLAISNFHEDVIVKKDPFRKALAISRYTKLRQNYDQQFLQEYLAIRQVTCPHTFTFLLIILEINIVGI